MRTRGWARVAGSAAGQLLPRCNNRPCRPANAFVPSAVQPNPYSHLFCVSHSQRTDRAMYERVLKDLNIRPLKKEV